MSLEPAEIPLVGKFATTHWSVVLSAADSQSPSKDGALEQLCRAYWPPLYAFVRRQGRDFEEARDLTQGFFEHLLEQGSLSRVSPAKGRFRTFLLTALSNFLANEWIKERRLKRGGGSFPLSLDDALNEERLHLEGTNEQTPALLFEKRWALATLETAMNSLRAECIASRKRELFEAVKSILAGEGAETGYSQLATSLRMSEGALKVAVLRLRRRYGELVRQEIERTVDSPADVEDELRHLIAVLKQ